MRLQPDLAEIDAGPETGFDGFFAPALHRYLDDVRARALVELVEFEIAIIIARGLRDRSAILAEANARALDAIDDAIHLRRQRAADEAFRVAPEIAVVNPRMAAQFGFHHFEILFVRQARHLFVLDLDRSHGSGRARLLAAGVLPDWVDSRCIKGRGLRQLLLFVSPDAAVGTGVDPVLAPLPRLGIDEHAPVLALFHRVAGPGQARRIVAVIAHRRNVGDVDHR